MLYQLSYQSHMKVVGYGSGPLCSVDERIILGLSIFNCYCWASITMEFIYFSRVLTLIIIWLCLTRSGNYQMHEFDWLKWILTSV